MHWSSKSCCLQCYIEEAQQLTKRRKKPGAGLRDAGAQLEKGEEAMSIDLNDPLSNALPLSPFPSNT